MAENWWEADEVVTAPKRMDQATFESARATLEDIARIKPRVKWNTTGWLGRLQAGDPNSEGMFANKSGFAGTPGYDLSKDIMTLQGRNVLNELGSLKAASPTGASGFGALSGSEGELLKATIGNLDIGQSDRQLISNLGRAAELTKRKFPGVSYDNPLDLSSGESRTSIPKGAYYKDQFGNIRQNMNFDAGNPKVNPRTGKYLVEGGPDPIIVPAKKAPVGKKPAAAPKDLKAKYGLED